MLAWMGVLGEVDINGQRNIRGSLEPHGREQGVHICLNHLHHFSPGMSFVEQEATEASNTNLSELRIQQHHPCRAPSRASLSPCAWLLRPWSKNGWVQVFSVYCMIRDAASSWGFFLSHSLLCKDFANSGGAGLLTTKISTVSGHKYWYWKFLQGLTLSLVNTHETGREMYNWWRGNGLN